MTDLIYFAAFGISVLFTIVSEDLYRNGTTGTGQKVSGWMVFALLAVISVSILNWIRDYSIGTDVTYYGNHTFNVACMESSFLHYFRYCEDYIGMHEVGYAALNYLVSRFTQSAHDFYLVLGLLVNGLAYAACCRARKYCPVTLSWLAFLLLFFPTTLNMLRQSLALVMVAYAFLGLPKTGWKRYLMWVLLAFLVHQSAAFALVLLPPYAVLSNCQDGSGEGMRRTSRALVWIVVFIAFVAASTTMLGALSDMGLLPSKYTQYLEKSNEKSLVNSVLIRIPFVLISAWLILARRDKLDAMEMCLLACALCEFALLPLQNVSTAAFRISLYFGIFKMASYPLALYRLKFPRWVSVPVLIAYLLFFFVYQVIYSGNGEVYPFVIAPDLFR